jgi:hypothetical protein
MIVCPALEEALLRRDDQAVRRLWDFQQGLLLKAEAQRDALLLAWNADSAKYRNAPLGGISEAPTPSRGEARKAVTARQSESPPRRPAAKHEIVREAHLEDDAGL